jgi:hypothetical protein
MDVIREMFDSYIPILHAIPDDVPGQYSVLRRFAENWADRPIPETIRRCRTFWKNAFENSALLG